MTPVSLLNTLLATLALASAGAAAESAEELIEKGDVFYHQLRPAEALKFYLPAEKLDSNNVRLLVRIARQYRHLMSDAMTVAEKRRLGSTAVNYARRAVDLGPDDSEAQLALAIGHGKMLPFLETKEKIATSRAIKVAANKVIALDPNNDLGWQVLGRWYFGLAEIGGFERALARVAYGKLPSATYADAVRCFEKAISLNTNRLMHYIELGRTYAKMDRDDDARKFITKGLAMPDTEKDDPETKEMGRQILKKLR